MAYYNKNTEDVLKEFSTSVNGLSAEEAASRLQKYGSNEIKGKKSFYALKSLAEQFRDLLIIILLVAAIISLILGEKSDAIVMLSIVMLNIIIGFVQEFKASRSIDALKSMITPITRVLRDGKSAEIPSKEVVIGDIMLLDEGCKITADARVIQAYELKTDESALTGENLPEKKSSQVIERMDLVPADQENMVFMGTNVAHGNAVAVVTATGKDTEFGKIAEATEEVKEEESPLQKEINYIGKLTAKATIVIGFIVILIGLFQGHEFMLLFIFAISLAVAVVPEGLPTTLSVTLAVGVQRMASQKAIVRKLSSVETLGSTTVICSDKTGTLTKNQMTATRLWINRKFIDITGAGYEPKGDFIYNGKKLVLKDVKGLSLMINTSVLCNNARLAEPSEKNRDWGIIGDPTEGALIVAAEKAGIKCDAFFKQCQRLGEMPFDSDRKRMITLNKYEGKDYAFLKGSPIEALSLCSRILVDGRVQKLTEKSRAEVLLKVKEMGHDALRVIAFGYKTAKTGLNGKNAEKDFIFLGLMGLLDPPRLEVVDAVRRCKEAGIRINIVTGDFGETAKAIAKHTGIANDNTPVITGEELEKMDDTRLQTLLRNECIFARATPAHKLRIITQLQKMGEIVAVTGDGVNDAPALKKADIGVAMGLSGTDVARESSDMVLSDDSFSTISVAVRQGRRIYSNIKKLIEYVYCGISAELFTVFIGLFLGFILKMPLPIVAIQILIIDLCMEVFPSIGLSFESEENGLMKRKPRNPKYRIMNYRMVLKVLFTGLMISAGALFLFYKTLVDGGWVPGMALDLHSLLYFKATTVTFVTIMMFQMFNAFNAKTESETIFSMEFFKNKFLILGVLISIMIVLVLTYVPFFNETLHLAPLAIKDWILILGISSLIIIFEEARKFAARKISGTNMTALASKDSSTAL